jgi:superfamily II DNA/RNA helicase
LHGNLSQPARDRNLAAFSAGEARVLVATDIAARGVHVDGIELVVHIDPPAEHKAYLHRSGRTARAGNAGDVVTVVLPEQRRDTQALMRRAGISVTPQEVTAESDAVHAVAGERAAYRAPAPKATTAPRPAQPRRSGAAQPRRSGAPGRRRGRGPRGSQRSAV